MSARAAPRYCLVSPCRDEAAFMRRTLDTLVAQSLTPNLWVIVDDGSSDASRAILAEYAKRNAWIRIIHREDRGRRSVGPGVVDAFYAGLEAVDLDSYEYIGKLDLDLELPRGYFQELIRRMEAEPRLGTCSGKAYYRDARNGRLISEGGGDEMSAGMTKLYRTACFREIGGFVHEVMWDGIDCHRCRQLGWIARSWNDEELRFVHLRPMGSSDLGIISGRVRHGRGQYFMGTTPIYMLTSAVYRMAWRPLIVGGLAMAWGFLSSALTRRPRYDDVEFRAFLRRYQWSCLLYGKRRATEITDQDGAARWRQSHPPNEGR